MRNKRAVNKKFLSDLAQQQTDTHTNNLALGETDIQDAKALEACIKITTESKCARMTDIFFTLTFLYDTGVIPLILSVRANENFIDQETLDAWLLLHYWIMSLTLVLTLFKAIIVPPNLYEPLCKTFCR